MFYNKAGTCKKTGLLVMEAIKVVPVLYCGALIKYLPLLSTFLSVHVRCVFVYKLSVFTLWKFEMEYPSLRKNT